MKTECNVARDLMPLCIDGVASGESRQYVAAHTAECTACKACYEEMSNALPAEERAAQCEEQAAFARAAHALKRTQRRRVRRNILLGVVLGAIVFLIALVGYNVLFVRMESEVSTEDYGLVLSQLSDGRVVVSLDYRDIRGAICIRTASWPDPVAENRYVQNLWMCTSILPKTPEVPNKNTEFYIIDDIDQYEALYIGQEEKKLIWQHGDAIAPASEEMEAYYQLQAEIEAAQWRKPIDDNPESPFYIPKTGSMEEKLSALYEPYRRLGELREQVPEWQ